jgi:Protein of unknown function (DUF4232)
MTDPHDPFGQWLAPRDTDYLPPPPGAFDRVYRTGRRRRWAKAGAGTAALAVALVGGFLAVQRLVGATPPGTPYQPAASGTPTASAPGRPTPSQTHSPAADHSRPPSSTDGRPSACTSGDVSVSAQPDPNSAGAGSYTLVFVVTTKAGATCTVKGYPRVTFADSGHRAVGAPFGTSGGTARTVTVKPHGASHVDSRQPIDPPAVYSDCRSVTAAGYLVTLPGDTTAVFAGADATKVCTNHIPTLDAPFAGGTGLSG